MGNVYLFFALDILLTCAVLYVLGIPMSDTTTHFFYMYVVGSFKAACVLIWSTISDSLTTKTPVYWAYTALFLLANVCLSLLMI